MLKEIKCYLCDTILFPKEEFVRNTYACYCKDRKPGKGYNFYLEKDINLNIQYVIIKFNDLKLEISVWPQEPRFRIAKSIPFGSQTIFEASGPIDDILSIPTDILKKKIKTWILFS